MLDEKDLQAIAGLMDEKIGASETRMMAHMEKEISASEARMMAYTREEIGASETRMMAYTREEIGASEARMMAYTREEIGASETRMMAHMEKEIGASEARMMAMMEAYFDPKFNLLADQIKLVQEKLISKEAVEDLEDRADVLEAAVKTHSREIEKLKKAQ